MIPSQERGARLGQCARPAREGGASGISKISTFNFRLSTFSFQPSRRFFNVVGPFLGLLLIIGLFSLSPTVRPYFLTGANFKIILTQTVIVAVGTLGMTIIIVSGGIDLSVGSVVALTSVVGATSLLKGFSVFTAGLLTIAVGSGIGLLNGLAIGGLRMMPFIVTLGMMGVARGTAKWLSGSQTVNSPETLINNIMELKEPTQLWPLHL